MKICYLYNDRFLSYFNPAINMTYLIHCIIAVSPFRQRYHVYRFPGSKNIVLVSSASYISPDYITIPVVESGPWDDESHLPIDIPVLKIENGQYWFAFHDARWLLFRERFYRTLSLDRLIEVLNSGPCEERGIFVARASTSTHGSMDIMAWSSLTIKVIFHGRIEGESGLGDCEQVILTPLTPIL